jgi:GTP cyclohydrolase I
MQSQPTSLPDTQNISTELVDSSQAIDQVGIHAFQLPLKISSASNINPVVLEVAVSSSAALDANVRALNMSRFLRVFYEFKDAVFTLESLETILRRYQDAFECTRCSLQLNFRYPMLQKSLKSGLEGYHFYPAAFEGMIDSTNQFRKLLNFEFTYASACPCSSALAQHAAQEKKVYAIAHSQRSIANIRAEIYSNAELSLEALQAHCLKALVTETQIMVKREDEQAFAELNGHYVKFVEDAVRQLYSTLSSEKQIKAFSIKCTHEESLHPYNVFAALTCGNLPVVVGYPYFV